ncbi:MAG: F0F1 ATP synthase subunit epsilon [Deltaproteobacteria bacterium]|nr:MAG: F0F1 ATP synthase subunit epsilon [Deltaproteobacteria bacterium]
MEETIHLDIVTPEKVIFSDSVDMVTAPGTLGEFGVLPGHADFVTSIEIGEVCIKKGDKSYFVAISGGFAEVMSDKVIILADTAEMSQEIDIKRAEAAKNKAEEKLKTISSEDEEYREIVNALKRAENRIRVSGRKG